MDNARLTELAKAALRDTWVEDADLDDIDPLDGEIRTAVIFWHPRAADAAFLKEVTPAVVLALLEENARLADALRKAVTELEEIHQPEWVSEQAKAAGKEPWVCVYCGVEDGRWPCATLDVVADLRLMLDLQERATDER